VRLTRCTDGDRQMLEYTQAGGGASLEMLVLHDDATLEYAYGLAQGLTDTKVGTFPQALYDEAKANGWFVISMKNDWKHIFRLGEVSQPLSQLARRIGVVTKGALQGPANLLNPDGHKCAQSGGQQAHLCDQLAAPYAASPCTATPL
jgi:hypothetical protein